MAADFHPLPQRDPITGGKLHVSELTGDESGITIRGRFALPAYSQLDADQAKFLEIFLRCRGTLSGVERELGISYPTVRARLDALLDTLGWAPLREPAKPNKGKLTVLEELERGEITPEEAKRKLRGEAKV